MLDLNLAILGSYTELVSAKPSQRIEQTILTESIDRSGKALPKLGI